MSQYIYWLNRRLERAIEAYLKGFTGDGMKVYRSSNLEQRQFPCAVVRAHQNRRYKGEVYAANRMSVSVQVMTEYARTVSDTAVVLEEFEAIEEAAVSSVLEALYIEDLATQLNAIGIPGVSISYAVPGSDDEDPVTSQSDEDGTVSIVEIPLVITAGATEI